MIHTVIVNDRAVFQSILKQTDAKKVPLSDISYKVYVQGNIRIVGEYESSPWEILDSVVQEFNPDTVFFLSESYPVSDEKQGGDIILPNVFFPYNKEIETTEIGKENADSFLSAPLFMERYPLQGDYDFGTFGLSVGGIHVSGIWNEKIEDFRIRLRVAYENDTFDGNLYAFADAGQKLSIIEKIYPVAYIGTEDVAATSRNLWSIVGFVIGSIDPDLISEEDTTDEEWKEQEDWVDGTENE